MHCAMRMRDAFMLSVCSCKLTDCSSFVGNEEIGYEQIYILARMKMYRYVRTSPRPISSAKYRQCTCSAFAMILFSLNTPLVHCSRSSDSRSILYDYCYLLLSSQTQSTQTLSCLEEKSLKQSKNTSVTHRI